MVDYKLLQDTILMFIYTQASRGEKIEEFPSVTM